MSADIRKELAAWTTICTACGAIPFVLAMLADSGKLGFIETVIDALK